MIRKASAHWTGGLKNGAGSLTTGTKTLNTTPYSFAARFEEGQGTNPEELLAAAHAGCFTMALSNALGLAGFEATSLDTECAITLDPKALGITKSELMLHAKVPNITREQFEQVALGAKQGCPVSKLFNAEITLSWALE